MSLFPQILPFDPPKGPDRACRTENGGCRAGKVFCRAAGLFSFNPPPLLVRVGKHENARCLDDRRTQGLTFGDFFASIGAFIKNLVFVDEAPFNPSHS
jgi:hypothetical protein